MTNITNAILDFDALPKHIQVAIETHCSETRQPRPTTVYDALHAYLMWEGIIGYTSDIARIVNNGKES